MPILPSIGRDVSRVLGVDSDAARRLLLGRSGQRKREQDQGEAQSREQALEARIRELMAEGVPYEVALKRASEDYPPPPPAQYPTVEFPLQPELNRTVPAALDSFPSGPPSKRPLKWAPREEGDGDGVAQEEGAPQRLRLGGPGQASLPYDSFQFPATDDIREQARSQRLREAELQRLAGLLREGRRVPQTIEIEGRVEEVGGAPGVSEEAVEDEELDFTPRRLPLPDVDAGQLAFGGKGADTETMAPSTYVDDSDEDAIAAKVATRAPGAEVERGSTQDTAYQMPSTDVTVDRTRPGVPPKEGRIELPPEPEVGGRPETIARILEVLGGIGAGIGESRSIGKANKLTAQRQALSNLVNTLRGSATTGVAREEPRAGLLQTLGEGLGAGGRTFRAGRKAGRDERNVAARQEFLDRIERQKGETGALKVLTGARGKPGLTAAEVRLYETFGENQVTGDPFSSFDPSLARQQILANNPGILETDMVAALSAVRAAATDRQREERKIVQDALADVFKEKGEVAPSQLVSQWETIVFTNGIYVPVEETERVIKAIEATAAITPLSAGNRTKLSNLFALRSGISRILGRLQDPAFEKHLSLLGSRKNALLGGISPRLYPPEVRQAMTELGFTSELLLRTFTGAAAPQTEFERFGQLFVGTLTDGRQALVSQLTGLDNGLQDQVNEIFVAAREGRGYKEPDKQDGDQGDGAFEEVSQEVLEALGELVPE